MITAKRTIPQPGDTCRVYKMHGGSFLVTIIEADKWGAEVRMPGGYRDRFPLTMLYPVKA